MMLKGEFDTKKIGKRLSEIYVGLKVFGDVNGDRYIGEIIHVNPTHADIRRFDKKTGGGRSIEYGNAWSINKKADGTWGASCEDGRLYEYNDIITSWKDELK